MGILLINPYTILVWVYYGIFIRGLGGVDKEGAHYYTSRLTRPNRLFIYFTKTNVYIIFFSDFHLLEPDDFENHFLIHAQLVFICYRQFVKSANVNIVTQ